jgi:carbonyl reductase 1
LADAIGERHGGADILLSNAAARISPEVPGEQQVRTFVDTNNRGALRVIKGFVPLLSDGSRFIAVASSFGTPASLHPRSRQRRSTRLPAPRSDPALGRLRTGRVVRD